MSSVRRRASELEAGGVDGVNLSASMEDAGSGPSGLLVTGHTDVRAPSLGAIQELSDH